ncbi:unnamed protein product [Alternaria burnsii]|nr:unnamed protein product [Alternaria burnsii]
MNCQYVALSYVWGGLVFKTDSTSGLLPSMLPCTIEDSIKATLLLGYRYLWVDAFCINQDDAEDKHHQIQQMDLIYTSAMLTLIAAAGNDPSYGLPGISNARKLRYLETAIGNVSISFTPKAVYDAVADSPWFTRGWTFQEGYLSRKRLYFTESGVLYICRKSYEHERFCRGLAGSGVSMLRGSVDSRAFEIEDDGHRVLHEVMRLLEQYMTRQLSYETDVLNAILGVLNYHHTRNLSIGTICGLPYQTSIAGPGIICLNWRHDRPATRRLGYPSWSPFGWVGPVRFSHIDYQFHPSEKDDATFSYHIRDGSANWNHLDTLQYLQITVSVHDLPIVNLVRSDSEDLNGMLSERLRTMLVVPAGGTKVNHGKLNYYMDITWDTDPPDHYNNTRVTCAIFDDHQVVPSWLMILRNHETHYERIGFASRATMLRAGGFHELAFTTNGIPTLRPMEGTTAYPYGGGGRDKKDFIWLQDITRKVTITLG